MGTSKQNRKYKKPPEDNTSGVSYRILINNSYYLSGTYDTWEEAELYGAYYTKGKRMSFVVTAGGSSVKPR